MYFNREPFPVIHTVYIYTDFAWRQTVIEHGNHIGRQIE